MRSAPLGEAAEFQLGAGPAPPTTGVETHLAPSAANLPRPYLLFLGDTTEPGYAKTAFGLRDWAAHDCVGEYACAGATVTTGLPFLTPAQAYNRGARALVIGVANTGGVIVEAWLPALARRCTPDSTW
ncbi:MAG: DUF1611 domain-containing protein [Caulobacteraceae bacterium]